MKKSKRKFPHCDYEGTCKNKAYAEVFPSMLGGKHRGRGWSYLCRKHYYEEERRYKWKLPAYILGVNEQIEEELTRTPTREEIRAADELKLIKKEINCMKSKINPRYVKKAKKIHKQRSIKIGSVANLRKRHM